MIAFFVGAGMAVTVDLWQLIVVIGGMIGCTAAVILYLDGRFSKLLPIESYNTQHTELKREVADIKERLRLMELWAARKNGPPT